MSKKQIQKSYELGQIVAKEELSDRYLGYSADYYKLHDDKMAKWFRTLSDNLKIEADTERSKYNTKYHSKEK
jgi:hypothetical protein